MGLAALLALGLASTAVQAQVVDTGIWPSAGYWLDEAPFVLDSGNVIPAYRGLGQSFIAPAADFTMGLRVFRNAPGLAEFRYLLYQGEGQGGRLLSDQRVSVQALGWGSPTLVEQRFSNLGIQPGGTYTLWAVNKDMRYPMRDEQASGNFLAPSLASMQGLDAYANGRMHVDGRDSGAGFFDLSFRLRAGNAPVNHGVFIGVTDPNGLRTLNGAAAAQMVKSAFDTRPNTVSHLLTGDLALGADGLPVNPVTNAQLAATLAHVRSQMGPNDTLTLYMHSHGNSSLNAGIGNLLLGQGDEYLRLGENLYDNWLAGELQAFGGRRITTFLDACHTGGFWGNPNALDIEERGKTDLDGVANLALYAAAPETGVTFMGDDGIGIYSRALADALLERPDLSGEALNSWLQARAYQYALQDYAALNIPRPRFFEMATGDEVAYSDGMFQPGSQFAAGYDQAAAFAGPLAAPVPEPATLGLWALGLGVVAVRRGGKR